MTQPTTRAHVIALLASVTALSVLLQPAVAQRAQRTGDRWVTAWSTALVGRPQSPPPVPPAPAPAQTPPGQAPPQPPMFVHFTNQTLREIVHTTTTGTQVRVVFSNVFGTSPLTIGAAHVALRDKDSAIAAATARPLTFSGQPTMTIPAGAVVVSDGVSLTVAAATDFAIDLYLPGSTNMPSPLTMHNAALQTSYVSDTGNFTGKATLPVVATTQSWFGVARVEVMAPPATATVVAFGDSITDGARSTPDTNNRWPDLLARRFMAENLAFTVANSGIGGNRVLSEGAYQAGINALARFDRDALDVAGVRHIIVLEGINDIGNARQNPTPTATDLIAGHKQLIERAHARGITIYGATLTPFSGAAYFTAEGEAKRQALNDWIRTSRGYDAVIDFDAATRDPAHPAQFMAQYDSGDHLHPNDAGYKAMADAIDLGLFKAPPAIARAER
jgi:lysophospholipase L1-like esterase